MKKKIFVVDDDDAITDALQMMLESAGYAVTASTDAEFLYAMKKDFPDLILLDIWLQGKDGRDVSLFLKRQDITKDIPIVVMSANRNMETISKEAQADDYLSKPFEMQELLDKVAKYTTH